MTIPKQANKLNQTGKHLAIHPISSRRELIDKKQIYIGVISPFREEISVPSFIYVRLSRVFRKSIGVQSAVYDLECIKCITKNGFIGNIAAILVVNVYNKCNWWSNGKAEIAVHSLSTQRSFQATKMKECIYNIISRNA